MSTIRAWAAHGPGQALVPFEYDAGELGSEEVEIAVEYSGFCHTDLSMLDNEWHFSIYPMVPGHEIIGRVVALGENARGLSLGQRVGLGWFAGSCVQCQHCLSGRQHLCQQAQWTILGRYGGFAERVRAHWTWTIALPEGLDPRSAGPLLCAGLTVFSPLVTFGIKPTDRVGVVGIGGLGHLALQFAAAWGCEVTAFTSNESKYEEARALGAHHVVSSLDPQAIGALAGSLDFLLVTVSVPLDWPALLATLAPGGRLHFVGFTAESLAITPFNLIPTQLSISGSAIGSPVTIAQMFQFAARHHITPQVEHVPMSKVNEAMEHLRAGKARYRIVLDADDIS